MDILFLVLSGLTLLISITSIGYLFNTIFPPIKIESALMYPAIGFVFYTAAIEILGWYMVAWRMQAILFAVLVALISLGSVIAALYFGASKKSSVHKVGKPQLFDWVLILAVIGLIIAVCVWYRSDADDSFYVSNVALFSASDRLNPYDSSFGYVDTGTVPMYDFQIWESLIAVYCKLFGINAAAMCHSVLPIILLIVAVSAYYSVAVLFINDSKKSLFVFILLVLMLFGGYSAYSKGSFLLSRLWQGKAVYLHVVLPVMIYFVLSEKTRKSSCLWLYLLLCVCSGISLNPTSLYVLGFGAITLLLSISIADRNYKYMLHLLPSLIPIAAVTLLIYSRASKFGGQIEAASQADNMFVFGEFTKVFNGGYAFLFLYLFAVVYIAIKGGKKVRPLFVYWPCILLVLIYNPLLGKIIAEHITMTPSYWRVFWLLPIEITISYACVLCVSQVKSNNKYRKLVIGGSIGMTIALIALSGKYMFSEQNMFVRSVNLERIPVATVAFGEYIDSTSDNNKVLLCPDEISTTVRQKYTDISVIYSRYQYVYDVFYYRGRTAEAEDRIELQNFVTGSETLSESTLNILLNKYNVNYVAIGMNCTYAVNLLEQLGYKCVSENGSYCLYEYGEA